MAIKQRIYLIFSPQIFYFFNGVNLYKTKYRWPRTISFFLLFLDLNIGLLATLLSFWQIPLLSTIARWYFLSKNYDCFAFFLLLMEIIKKLLCSFIFQQNAGQNSTTYGETAPTPLYNIRTYLFILSQ